jgi:hypothetical protein
MVTGWSRSMDYFKLFKRIGGWSISVAYRFASVYHPLVIIPLLNAYTPKIFEKFAQKEYKQKIYHLLSFAIVVFSILALITPYIAKFMIDKTYYDALPLIRPLVLGYGIFFFNPGYRLYSDLQKENQTINNKRISSLIF